MSYNGHTKNICVACRTDVFRYLFYQIVFLFLAQNSAILFRIAIVRKLTSIRKTRVGILCELCTLVIDMFTRVHLIFDFWISKMIGGGKYAFGQ